MVRMMPRRSALLPILAICASIRLFAVASDNWTAKNPNPSPNERTDSSMVYDAARNRAVLFGGQNADLAYNETWLWDGFVWTQATPATSPPARYGHAMAYDSVRQQVVLFGGTDQNGDLLSDTWVWNGTNWTQKILSTHPSARTGHGMVFDTARSQAVLFGGTDYESTFADTWTWDGTNWTLKSPANSPSARELFGFTYDSGNGRSVLFGGYRAETVYGDTWIWNGTNWTLGVNSGAPSPRYNHVMAYDSTRTHVVLFGGSVQSTNSTTNETWYYTNSGWTLFTSFTSPTPAYAAAMTFDPVHAQTVLVTGDFGDHNTWLLGALQIYPTSLPNATMGTNYNLPFGANGGQSPYNFSVTGLPPGLSRSGNSIVGLCSGESSTGVTVSVTDSASPANTASVGPLPLHCNPAPVLTTPSPQQGILGIPYSLQFQTNAVYDPPGAAPYTWSKGSLCQLPSNFTLSSTGLLTGTASDPTMSQVSYACPITFTDRWGATANKTYVFNFYAPLTVVGGTLPSGSVGTAYPTTSVASFYTGGAPPVATTLTGLPSGLSYNSSNGTITGTPTQYGAFSPLLTATDNYGETGQASLALTISAAALNITTASPLPTATQNVAYSRQFAASGGSGTYTWSTTSVLPAGLTLSSGGLLSGTPTAAGSTTFSVTVNDSVASPVTKQFTITVNAELTITTASPLPSATVNAAYSQQFVASGGSSTYTWSATSALPAGLTLSSSGLLSGTPTAAGSTTFSVTVNDGVASPVTKQFTITVNSALTITTASSLPSTTVNAAYSQQFAASGGSGTYTWSATSALPAGLTLSSSGLLSGTPTASGSTTFSVTVNDGAASPVTKQFTITVNAALTITTASPLPSATVNAAYSQQFVASGSSGSYTWSTTSALPAGLTLSSSGLLSGTPTASGSTTFSVTVNDGVASPVTKQFTITVNAALTITTASPLPSATVNAAYSQQFAASGGSGTYTWSTTSALPAGLTLSTSGLLSGTPTAAGSITFSVTVNDGAASPVAKQFTITVNSALTIDTTSPLPAATVNAAYSQQFAASGGSGTYTWSTSSTLPSGLTLSSSGLLSGTPTAIGSTTFSVTVNDRAASPVTKQFTITVNSALTITTASPLSAATLNAAYSQQFAASGGSGTYTWSTSSTLPAGLTLSSSGLLSGTPTAAGSTTFSVAVNDGAASPVTKQFTITVNSTLTITTASPLSAATLNAAYSQQFAASGGSGTYTWSTTSTLPAGLTLTSSGLLSGTPTAAGSTTFSVAVNDGAASPVTKQFTITVNSTLTITTASPLSAATLNAAYSQQFAASGGSGTYTWSTSSTLPSGLTLSSSGLLSGTPTAIGSTTFSVTVNDRAASPVTKQFTITVNSALTITTASPLSAATLNAAYSQQFAASGGSGTYTWSTSSTLPAGLTLSSSGLLSGTPTAAGSTTFSVAVNDGAASPVTKQFTITVNSTLTITTASPLSAATLNAAYSQQFAASGGSGTYTWSTTSTLPAGLTLTSSGLLSGTPTAAGSTTFSVAVNDGAASPVTKQFTIIVNSTLTITTASPLPAATLNAAYSQQFAASGGSGTYTWSTASTLPTGLTLSSNGLLSGTPTAAGSATFSVTVVDSSTQSVIKDFRLDINSALNITTSTPLPSATVGMPYSTGFSASGGLSPYTWSTAAPIPSWLTLSSSGTLSGTPPTADPVTFTVIVSDSSSNQFGKAFTLPVNALLTIDTASPLPDATVSVPYGQQLSASGGSGRYSWTASNLPSWLTLSSTGLLSGTPPSAGIVSFTATVSDSAELSATSSFTLAVDAAIRIDTASPLSPATISSPYTLQFAASGGTGRYTWAGVNLPAGFSLSSGGLLTGTPSTSGTLSFTVQVTDDRSNSTSASFTLPVSLSLSISNTSPLPAAVPLKVYALQFNASGGSGVYTWSSSGLPSWLKLSPAGFLTGIPPAAGSVSFAVTVADALGRSATQSFTLPVISAVSITTPPVLPTGLVGRSISIQLAATGGTGKYSFGGTGVPLFLSLSPTGLLSGVPGVGGNFNFNITVTDASNASNSANQTFTLSVAYPTPPSIITSSPLPVGTVGTAYTVQFAANGGSGFYTWTASNLPASFSFSGMGQLSGTPVTAGDFSFTVVVTDSQGGQIASRSYTLSVSTALTITSSSPLPTAVTGTPYSAQLAASGGLAPYTWSATGLTAPFSISSSGLLTGMATSAATINFTATVRDAAGRTASRSFTISVNAVLTITSPSILPSGVANTPYTTTLSAVGGIGAYTWTGIALPTWATLSSGGILTGTPPIAGSFTINVSVSDTAKSTVSKQFTIFIASGTPLTFLSSTLAPCVVNVVCTQFIGATGGTPPYTYSLVGPAPTASFTLSLNGQLTATFTAPGSISFQVLVTDALQSRVTGTLNLLSVIAVSITAPETATAPLAQTFTLSPVAVNGAPPYTWSLAAGTLPPGISLSSLTGVLSGIPTQPGTYTFTLQVSDLTGSSAKAPITIVVPAQVLTIQTPSVLPTATAGSTYTQVFQAVNGSGSLTWSLISGSVPPGLMFSSAGILSGTPSQSGDFAFALQVADEKGSTDRRSFQIHVSGPSQPLPPVRTALSATVNAGEQPSVTLTLGSPYPLPITVIAKLSLTPSQGDSTDLLFPNGSRTIQFILPANTTEATVPFQAGTLAGTIQISFQLQAAGVDLTPSPAPSANTQISASAPVLRTVSVVSVSGGLQLTVIGFSTTRDMKNAAFHFAAANGASLQLTDVTVDVSSAFAQWYASPASFPTGSQFALTVPISVAGSVSSIDSVSITLTNSVGASASATAKVQ